MRLAGIILLVVGLAMTLYTGFTYVTTEKVVDIGDLKVTRDEDHTVNWQPYFGVGVMIVGAVVLLAGRKKSPLLGS
jgi:formate-dependent nitrite reductase membrane component NrfD